MAETVGSIMGKNIGKGRFLKEESFSKDLVLGDKYTVTDTVVSFNDNSVGILEQ